MPVGLGGLRARVRTVDDGAQLVDEPPDYQVSQLSVETGRPARHSTRWLDDPERINLANPAVGMTLAWV